MQTFPQRAKLIVTLATVLLGHLVFGQAKPTQRWGLIIGAQDYQHYPRLKYARSDAKRFRDFLVKDLSFSPEATRLLVDGSDADTKPSAGNILGALEAIL